MCDILLGTLEWPHFSNYKTIGIFPDAQGQLTPQSVVGSGRISNSNKEIQSIVEALDRPQHYTQIFQALKGSLLGSQWRDVNEIQRHPSFLKCPPYLQE